MSTKSIDIVFICRSKEGVAVRANEATGIHAPRPKEQNFKTEQ